MDPSSERRHGCTGHRIPLDYHPDHSGERAHRRRTERRPRYRAALPRAAGPGPAPGCVRDDTGLRPVAEALTGLIDGSRADFPHAIDLNQGTPFQRAVWKALMDIRHGETITYAELARRVGRPKAIRAVGQANGANPLPVVVPCHRVVAANGKLGGYTGGVDIKEHLLFVEGLR